MVTGQALIVCFGEAMLRSSTGPDGAEVITPGGAEYNVACALARLGNRAAWVSALPSGNPANEIRKPAEEAGVDLLVIESENQVGTYRISSGEVEYNRANSAFAQLESGAINWREVLTGARWLVVSGITPLLGDGPRANWSAAMTFAELDGALVALDLNHRPALGSFDRLWTEVEPRLRQVHLLILSTENLLSLTGNDDEAALDEIRGRWNLPYVACTWKQNGDGGRSRWSAVAHSMGVASTREKPVRHEPTEPLGGGDAWLAGFIDGLLEGCEPEACCHRGDLLAALTQRTFGDLGDISREELSRWESIEGAVHLSADG